jgi:hypothetical protein
MYKPRRELWMWTRPFFKQAGQRVPLLEVLCKMYGCQPRTHDADPVTLTALYTSLSTRSPCLLNANRRSRPCNQYDYFFPKQHDYGFLFFTESGLFPVTCQRTPANVSYKA